MDIEVLEVLANIGEFVSSIGVIGTLVFLIVEVRRNTKATTQQTLQETFSNFSSVRSMLTQSPTLAEALNRLKKGEGLSGPEEQQLEAYFEEMGFAIVYYYRTFIDTEDEGWKSQIEYTVSRFARTLDNEFGRRFLNESILPKWMVEMIYELQGRDA